MSVLLVFVDGIGLGTPGAHNPFDGAARSILRPLGGRDRRIEDGWHLKPLDATLGVPGLPQSATGTATILTGINVSQAIGEHLWAFPDRRIKPLIEQHSILRRAREAGRRAVYLNAFPRDRARSDAQVPRGACTLAALAGGGELVTIDRVLEGRAATFDLTHEIARAFGFDLPIQTVAHAARAVARGTQEHDLALFELFLTDKAGHRQDVRWARHEIQRTERFLEALTSALDDARDTIVVISDHGNLDDLSTRGHTMAQVPALAWGRRAETLMDTWEALTDVGPGVLELAVDQATDVGATMATHAANGERDDR